MGKNTKEAQVINETVGKRILEFRLTRGLSRQQLAYEIDVTHQQLSKYEEGANKVNAGRLALLSKILEVPISDFFEEVEFEPPSEHKRLCMEVSRSFMKIANKRHQRVVADIINSLADI